MNPFDGIDSKVSLDPDMDRNNDCRHDDTPLFFLCRTDRPEPEHGPVLRA